MLDSMTTQPNLEEGLDFTPRFDSNGLIPAIAQDAKTGQILMVAYMNAEALDQTIRCGYAVYFSRSRNKLWRKGEESGHVQKIQQILVDCDQDCLLLKVNVDQGQCHTGHQSCFYRALEEGQSTKLIAVAHKVYDPKQAYRAR
jgi:phosphoribosyl-AMP cyclohydrolase